MFDLLADIELGKTHSIGSPVQLVEVKTWISKIGDAGSAVASRNKIPWYGRSLALMPASS